MKRVLGPPSEIATTPRPSCHRTGAPRATYPASSSPIAVAELSRVARQGYATAIGELEAGYVALGAPVRWHDGRVVAAISLGGPTTRFTDARVPGLLKALRESAARVSHRLGWVPVSVPSPARRSVS